jgi:hypothetical protein
MVLKSARCTVDILTLPSGGVIFMSSSSPAENFFMSSGKIKSCPTVVQSEKPTKKEFPN